MKKKIPILIIAFCFILFLICLSPVYWADNSSSAWIPADTVVTATGALDGDTIRVGRGLVDLAGIDCPEIGQAYGQKAKKFVYDIACGKEVTIRYIKYKKQLFGEVVLPDGRILNREIMSAGLAWYYKFNTKDRETLHHLYLVARGSKKGLWRDYNPMPPWEWRRRRIMRMKGYKIPPWR